MCWWQLPDRCLTSRVSYGALLDTTSRFDTGYDGKWVIQHPLSPSILAALTGNSIGGKHTAKTAISQTGFQVPCQRAHRSEAVCQPDEACGRAHRLSHQCQQQWRQQRWCQGGESLEGVLEGAPCRGGLRAEGPQRQPQQSLHKGLSSVEACLSGAQACLSAMRTLACQVCK